MLGIKAFLMAIGIGHRNADNLLAIAVYFFHLVLQADGMPPFVQNFGHTLPHLARAEPGIVELLNQGRNLIFAGQKFRSEHRKRSFAQVQILDALGRPVRPYFSTLHPPHFFGVGLEEHCKQALTEAVGHPLLEVFFFPGGKCLRFKVTEPDQNRLR